MSSLFADRISATVWSYSRVNSYVQCPKMFYLTYIDKADSMESAFGQWGSLCHSLLEDYAKGTLLSAELSAEYDARYPQYMTERFPPNKWTDLDAKYYDAGKEYFHNFEGFPENWNILAVEQEIALEIFGVQFTGYIDLLVRDKTDNMLIVVDHKSKSGFKNTKELEHYGIQLYLYSLWVKQQYGEFPKELIFNMFRAGEIKILPFTEDGMKNAQNWLEQNISSIMADEDFADKIEISYAEKGKPIPDNLTPDFFCRYLCSARHRCERSGFFIGGHK